MLMPALYNNMMNAMDMMDDFDNWFGFGGNELETYRAMRTDVVDKGNSYEMKADLPGFRKEDISLDLKDGVMTISAKHDENKDEKDDKGRYIRRERYNTAFSRSFSVSDDLKPEDITAKYEDGVLTIDIPKKEVIPEKEEAKKIEIH